MAAAVVTYRRDHPSLDLSILYHMKHGIMNRRNTHSTVKSVSKMVSLTAFDEKPIISAAMRDKIERHGVSVATNMNVTDLAVSNSPRSHLVKLKYENVASAKCQMKKTRASSTCILCVLVAAVRCVSVVARCGNQWPNS